MRRLDARQDEDEIRGVGTGDPSGSRLRAYTIAIREVRVAPTRYAWARALRARRELLQVAARAGAAQIRLGALLPWYPT